VRFTIRPLPPRFDLKQAVSTYGYYMLAPTRWDKQRLVLEYPFRGARDRLIPARVTQRDDALIVTSPSSVSAAERGNIRTQVRRMLRLDEDLSPWFAVHAAARRQRFGRLFRSTTLFEDVVRTMTGCNVTWSSTIRMNQLLCDHVGGGGFPTPQQLAAVKPDDLKQRCKVGYRAERIVRLARDVAEGRIDIAALDDPTRDRKELYGAFAAIHGVGPYAARNLLQHVGCYDHVPIDSETYRHFREVHGMSTPKTPGGLRKLHARIERHYARYEPYQFLAYWFELWHRYDFG
jgi:3-methyladenine DNA glycosylase/8-oxoguanine DNA glycosylase